MTKSKSESTEVAVVEPAPLPGVLPANQWQLMRKQMGEVLDSGFLPESIKTVEQAVAVVLTGRELGLQPMESLRSINIIKGKPTLSAELLTGLALRHVPGAIVEIVESTNTGATVKAQRPGGKPQTFTFTEEDARRASLLGKTSWKMYPAHMYRWRALSAACKAVFPDAVLGLYTPEELGAEVNVEGEVIEIPEEDTSIEDEQARDRKIIRYGNIETDGVEIDVIDPSVCEVIPPAGVEVREVSVEEHERSITPEPPADDSALVNPAKAKQIEKKLEALKNEDLAWALRKMVVGDQYKPIADYTKDEARELGRAIGDNVPAGVKVYHEGDECGNIQCEGKLELRPAGIAKTGKNKGKPYKAFLGCSEWRSGCKFKADVKE